MTLMNIKCDHRDWINFHHVILPPLSPQGRIWPCWKLKMMSLGHNQQVINIIYYKWAVFAGLQEMKDLCCFCKVNKKKGGFCTYQHSEGLIKPPVEARHAVEVEALWGFADHAAVLHRIRAYCKQWTNHTPFMKVIDQRYPRNFVIG